MKKILTHIVLLLLFAFISVNSVTLYAQTTPYSLDTSNNLSQIVIDSWTTENGLPTNVLNQIYQSKDGYIWITSYEGLIRFDGMEFTVFNRRNTKQLKTNSFTSLIEDKNGVMWFASQGNGLTSYKDGAFLTHGLDQGISQLDQIVFADSHNRIWSGVPGKGCFYFENGKFNFIDKDSLLLNADINSMKEDKSGIIYIATSGSGLYKYENDSIKFCYKSDDSEKDIIYSLFLDDDELMLCTASGILKYDGHNITEDPLVKSLAVNKIVKDKNGLMLVATENGLCLRNDSSFNSEFLNKKNGLPHNYVYDAIFDFEGNLWLSLYRGGLVRLKSGKFQNFGALQGLQSEVINAISEYKPNELLLGYDNGVISKFNNGVVSEFVLQHNIKGKRIRHILSDSKKNLWISMYGGLLKIENTGKELWYSKVNNFPTTQIRLTYEDKQGNIWVGTRSHGLIKIMLDDSCKFISQSDGLSMNLVTSIDQDNNGKLIVGTAGGGINVLFDDKVIKTCNVEGGLIADIILNTYVDKDNVLWIAGNGGISRVENKKITNYSIDEGLGNDTPLDIVEDDFGIFWIPFNYGIMKVSKQLMIDFAKGKVSRIECTIYDKYDGVKLRGFTPVSQSLKDSSGKLHFPALVGMISLIPEKIQYNTIKPPVYITQVMVDNQVQSDTSNIHIQSGKKRYKFTYTAICLHAPEKVRYKYKLDGYENQWTLANANERTVSYTNLPYGDYTFRVKACNNDGLWNEEGDSITFHIEPFFYETVCFFIFCIVLLILLIIAISFFRIIQLKKSKQQLEETVKERTNQLEITNEDLNNQKEEVAVHAETLKATNDKLLELGKFKQNMTAMIVHDLKNPLNSIMGISNQKEVIQLSRNLLNLVMNVLDVQKFEEVQVSLNKSVNKILTISNQALEQVSLLITQKSINIKNSISTYFFVKADAELIERVFVNILTNAIKYTPNNGTISLNTEIITSEFIKISISDTGQGIPKENLYLVFDKFQQVVAKNSGSIRSTGLGLTFCKLVTEAHGGEIGVESKLDEGTTFWFTLPAFDDYKTIDTENDDANIKSQIQLTLKETLLSSDKEILAPFIPKFKEIEVYFVSDLMEILEQIKTTKNIEIWKKEMQNAIESCNEEKYSELIDI